jgi:hypothetical protein
MPDPQDGERFFATDSVTARVEAEFEVTIELQPVLKFADRTGFDFELQPVLKFADRTGFDF